MENFKIVIKTIKPRVKETDPDKIAATKEKRRVQREAKKNEPKKEKEPKQPKKDNTDLENINKTIKNLLGFTIEEMNQKLIKPIGVQVGPPVDIIMPIKETKKRGKKNI